MSDYAARLRDAILDRSALTDDLLDDEAELLLNWALQQADRVAALMQNETDMETKSEALMDLVKAINRLVAYRFDKDETWFSAKLNDLNNLSTSINGPATDATQQAVLLNHTEKSNLDLLQDLLNAYTPTAPLTPEDEIELHTATEPDLQAALDAATPAHEHAEVEVDLSSHSIEPYEEPASHVVNYSPLADEIETYRPPATDIQPYDEE